MKNNAILCIDLKSFYASVECIDRGLNPFEVPLVVADKSRGGGSIVLAVSPYLRNKGVPSRLRVYELPKDDDIIFACPRMARYLSVSAQVVSIFLDYVNEDDLHVYSIDESFLDLTHYLKFYNMSIEEIAENIKQRIYDELHLTCTIGIGPNMLLAKIAMDIEAKHNKNRIAKWTYDDVQSKLWNVYPLSKMWGIGANYEKKLNALGIYKVGDLAKYPKKLLVDKFGVMGGQLHDHANGIDETDIRVKYIPVDESLTSGQVLMRDYTFEEMPLIIREMLDDLLLRMIYQQRVCKTVSLFIGYSKETHGGFSHQLNLDNYTDDVDELYDAIMSIYNRYIQNKPIRNISICLAKIEKVEFYQTNLFQNSIEQARKRRLLYTIARIKEKYGSNSILRCDSKLPSSNIHNRHSLIGGHRR